MKELEIDRDIILTAEGLAVFRKEKIAAASDLHIGFEEALGEQLVHIQTKLILEKILRVVERHNPREVVLNGDIKYTFGKKSKQEWQEISFFFSELLKKVNVTIIKGNHDFYLKNIIRDLNIAVLDEYSINGITFMHGDKEGRPSGELLVIGNEHPSITLRDEIGAVRKYSCFIYLKKERVIVLPALNPWTYGTDILSENRAFLSPILRSANITKARVYVLDGQEIYDFKNVEDIRKLLLA